MLHAVADGERDSAVTGLARKRLHTKTPQLVEAAPDASFDRHAFLVRVHLKVIDQHATTVDEFAERSRW